MPRPGFQATATQPTAATDGRPARAPKRRSALQRPGLIYALVTVFVAIGAINSQNNLLFIIFGLLVGSVIVSGFLGGGGMMGVRVTRSAPASARVGEPFTLRYRLHNLNRVLPAGALVLEERPEGGAQLVHQPRGFVDMLPARSRGEAPSLVVPARRGLLKLPAFDVRSRFPLGLTEKRLRFTAPASVLIRPARVRLAPRALTAAVGLGSSGATGSRRPGPGDEFAALRDYVPGDDARRIAWRPSARLGQPVIRIPGAPVPRRTWVVLSAASADDPGSIERAVALAGTLAEFWSREGRSTGLLAPGLRLEPAPGRVQGERLLDALATWTPTPVAGESAMLESCAGAVGLVRTGSVRAAPVGASLVLHADDASVYEDAGASLPVGLRLSAPVTKPARGGRAWVRGLSARRVTAGAAP